jgi:aminoglycoside phosphotransferase family enzyme
MNTLQVSQLIKEGRYRGTALKGTLIETHISWVILTKNYAFKIKKPLKYSFLDFSTIIKRKFYCEQEVKLNRRLTDIYLGIVPILSNSEIFDIDGNNGTVIDYAVMMKRMQSSKRMDLLLRKNVVKGSQMKILAEDVASFHSQCQPINTRFNLQEMMNKYNDLNIIKDWAKCKFEDKIASIIDRAIELSDNFLNRHEDLLRTRIVQGYYREGHGDLHSRNIFLYKKPIIFDCIEFDKSSRQIDVLNELAFFCMDLEAFNHPELAKLFLTEYLKLMPCMEGEEEERLFTYYKAYRANVRAKVNGLRAIQSKDDIYSRQCTEEVRKYLILLAFYLNQLSNNRSVC